jgi:dTDP-4-dehydrorhamnose reductase
MKKILITGASGVVGSNLAFFYKGRYQLTGVYLRHAMALAGATMLKTDLLRPGDAAALLDRCCPDTVIHCAGLPYIDECEKDPERAYRQNVTMTENLVRALEGRDTRLVFISTDNVYGDDGPQDEEDGGLPINEYGCSKRLAEQAALTIKDAVVLRTTFFGCGTSLTQTHSEQLILSLSRKEKIRAFTDVFLSPVYIFDLAAIIEDVVQKKLTGIFNIGSSEGISRYELWRQIASRLGLEADLIEPVPMASVALPARRKRNAVMKTQKIARALGRPMPGIVPGVTRFTDDLKKGFVPQGSALGKIHSCTF